MEVHGTPAQPAGAPAGPPFARVVCGVDGSRGGHDAAVQAAELAPGASLHLVAVAYVVGTGRTAMADLSPQHATVALDRERRELRERGIEAETEVVRGQHAARQLMDRAAAADLIAVGAHPGGRVGGILLDATASQLAHRAPVSVLVARHLPRDAGAADRVVVATDGSPCSDRAVALACAIARTRGSEVTAVHAGGATGEESDRMARQAVALREALGVEPLWLDDAARAPVDAILDAARVRRSTLVVLGARGVGGLRALGSVSERVVHRARCSVLIAR